MVTDEDAELIKVSDGLELVHFGLEINFFPLSGVLRCTESV